MFKNNLKFIAEFIKDKIKIGKTSVQQQEGKKYILLRQMLNVGGMLLFLVIGFILLIIFVGSNDKKVLNIEDEILISEEHQSIELATDGTKSAVKWQNFLEDSINQEAKAREEQLGLIKQTIDKKTEEVRTSSDYEFNEIKARLSYALNEIERLKNKQNEAQNDIMELADKEDELEALELGMTQIVEETHIKPAVSSYNNIPATSYISGNLLGGIAVSTSVNTASNPIPVIIKITNRGNLPKSFAVKLDDCRLLASCYGDISSERAFIRAEELVCENKEAGLISSTKVAGVIYGDDGTNGIRGTVVSMSNKHLKSAAIEGVLSGFASVSNGQSSFDITSSGAVSSKSKGIKDMAKEGFGKGVTTAAEKLADYHIKMAENISPVILVPGGTKVDIVFTKSVQIGSIDVEDVIKLERGKK